MGALKGQSIIQAQQFADPGVLDEFLQLVEHYEDLLKRGERATCLRNRSGALEFYEPSTRTRMSFERAIRLLGGDFSFTENAAQFSSAAKGERLEHSVRVLAGYHFDFIVLRHTKDDAAEVARNYLQAHDRGNTVIINAGCGMGQHPTQALTDWWTIRKEFGRTNTLRLCIVGDLARGRTARSLAYLMGRQENVQIDFVSPPQLRMEDDILAYLRRHNISCTQYGSIDEVLELADVVYMTRVQKERPYKGVSMDSIDTSPFRITVERAQRMKKGSVLMHPMPIVDEIESAVDHLPQTRFFHQSDNGVPVRMALLHMVLCT